MSRSLLWNGVIIIITFIICRSMVTAGSSNLCTDASKNGFDVQNLTQICAWEFSIAGCNCSIFDYPQNQTDEPCNIIFTVCDAVPSKDIYANIYSSNSKLEKPLGNFSDYVLLDNGFSINNSATADDPKIPYIQLDFICDLTATLGNCSQLEKYNETFDEIKVHATVAFAGACVETTTSVSITSTKAISTAAPGTTAKPTIEEGLSTGSILLIIFFVALILYLLGGIIWNHVQGIRGIEMIPNIEFWRSLPGYIVDGFIYFFTLITCGPCRQSTAEAYDRM